MISLRIIIDVDHGCWCGTTWLLDGATAKIAIDAGADWIVTGNLCEEFADAHELQITLENFITKMET